jgi:MscS family membrane protein
MLDRTELSVPNGQLANMNVENLSRRDKNLFRTKIGLRCETSPDQLWALLTEMRTFLYQHPKVDPNVARVRFVGFGESSLDVEIYCHVLTSDWNEFLALREEMLLRIMEQVADADATFAFPSRTLYMAHD